MASFVFNGLGLSLGANLVSTNDRRLLFSMLSRLFPTGGVTTNNCAIFCTIRLDVLQGMPEEIFAQNIKIWPA